MGFWAGLGAAGQASVISSLLGGGGSSGGIQPSSIQTPQINYPNVGGEKKESNSSPVVPTNTTQNIQAPIIQDKSPQASQSANNVALQNIFEQEELKRKMAGLR